MCGNITRITLSVNPRFLGLHPASFFYCMLKGNDRLGQGAIRRTKIQYAKGGKRMTLTTADGRNDLGLLKWRGLRWLYMLELPNPGV
jgi:hypothetical protein